MLTTLSCYLLLFNWIFKIWCVVDSRAILGGGLIIWSLTALLTMKQKPNISVETLWHNQILIWYSQHIFFFFFFTKDSIYNLKSHWRYASCNPSMYTFKVLLNYYTKHLCCSRKSKYSSSTVSQNRPFPNYLQPLSQKRVLVSILSNENEISFASNLTHVNMNCGAPGHASIERLWVTRNWTIRITHFFKYLYLHITFGPY